MLFCIFCIQDRILRRSKSFNAISLIDTLIMCLEAHYSKKLIDFAHGKITSKRRFLLTSFEKAHYLTADQILRVNGSEFKVPSESQEGIIYSVNTDLG